MGRILRGPAGESVSTAPLGARFRTSYSINYVRFPNQVKNKLQKNKISPKRSRWECGDFPTPPKPLPPTMLGAPVGEPALPTACRAVYIRAFADLHARAAAPPGNDADMPFTPLRIDPYRLPKAFLLLPPAVAAAVLLAVALTGRQAGIADGFPLDDAWIHMVYGRSLATEGLLAYNPGVAATGSTAPLWSACVGLAHLLLQGVSVGAVVAGVQILGGLLHLLTVIVAGDLAARLSGERKIGLLAGMLVAWSPPLAAVALSGMEATLAGLLLVLGVRAALLAAWWRAGVFLALACTARPEAAAVGVVVAVFSLPDLRGKGGAGMRAAMGLIAPAVVLAALWLVYNHAATGRLLPATFYFKQDAAAGALPGRLATAFGPLLGQVAPFKGYVAWLAAAGLLWRPDRRMLLPLAAGLAFLVANVAVLPPVDPAAFYHLRYVLPAVPLLAAALAVGAHRLELRLPPRLLNMVPAALLALAAMGGFATLGPVARHLHNDVRNIDEVQVSLGKWLDANTAPDAWIGATDAGAVRYFARRPAIDLLGLNTPEFHWDAENYRPAHPVDAVACMPAWVSPDPATGVHVMAIRETGRYTVTSFPEMARQVVLAIPNGTAGPDRAAAVPVAFRGWRPFVVHVAPGGVLAD
jgi:hypothetical protein